MLDAVAVDDLPALRTKWNHLADLAATPFASFEWFYCFARACDTQRRLRILVHSATAGVDAIAPLVEVDGPGGTRLEILGATPLGEPCRLLYRDEAALHGLVEGLIALRRPIEFRRLPAESGEIRAIQQAPCSRALMSRWSGGRCAYTPLTGTFDTFAARLSTGRRADLRRKARRAETMGHVRYEWLTPTVASRASLLEEAYRIEASSWKGRDGTAVARDRQLRAFLELYTEALTEQGLLRVGFLYIADIPRAMLVAVIDHGALWTLKIGYDSRLAHCSLGMLLTYESIRFAFSERLLRYEFCGRNEPWQHSWTEYARSYVSVALYPLSSQGIVAFGLDSPRHIARRVKAWIQSPRQRRSHELVQSGSGG